MRPGQRAARARSTSRPTERSTSAQQPPSPATDAPTPTIGAPQPHHPRCPAESARRAGSDSPRQRRRGSRHHHHPCCRQTHRQTHGRALDRALGRRDLRRHSSAVAEREVRSGHQAQRLHTGGVRPGCGAHRQAAEIGQRACRLPPPLAVGGRYNGEIGRAHVCTCSVRCGGGRAPRLRGAARKEPAWGAAKGAVAASSGARRRGGARAFDAPCKAHRNEQGGLGANANARRRCHPRLGRGSRRTPTPTLSRFE